MTRKKAKGVKPKVPLQQQLEKQPTTAIGGWLREKAKEATASTSRLSPPAPSTTAATSLALDEHVASSPLPLSSDEGEMDTECSCKRTHAASDSDESAGPPKQAATIAAVPPALDDTADSRDVQETPASVPAATTLPPEERTEETAHARALDAAQQLPASQHRGRRATPEPRPSRCRWGLRHRGLQGGTAEGQGPGSRGCRDGPRSVELRDIIIETLIETLKHVINYLPEEHPLQERLRKATSAPLHMLQNM
ncbi:hypothetical protein MTO96_012166 [Rhipicephalus appendiculatus]